MKGPLMGSTSPRWRDSSACSSRKRTLPNRCEERTFLKRMGCSDRWESRWFVHTALLTGSFRDCVARVDQISRDRKSTRLNSSHQIISYAVFCLKKKKQMIYH